MHDQSLFVTLTYNDESLPEGGSLVTEHYKGFLKRLRSRVAPRRFRFFLVGEYGDESWRPHYHACLFGLGYEDVDVIEDCWKEDKRPLGFVHFGDFNQYTAQYCAGYVVKKLTAQDDPRLEGRYPEFARMSLKPGLGADAMAVIALALECEAAQEKMADDFDVPREVRFQGRKIALGRYLRERLRKEVGVPVHWKEIVKQAWALEQGRKMSEVWEDQKSNSEVVSLSQALVSAWQGRIWSIEAKSKIQRSKKL